MDSIQWKWKKKETQNCPKTAQTGTNSTNPQADCTSTISHADTWAHQGGYFFHNYPFVCLLAGLHKNNWKDFHYTWWRSWSLNQAYFGDWFRVFQISCSLIGSKRVNQRPKTVFWGMPEICTLLIDWHYLIDWPSLICCISLHCVKLLHWLCSIFYVSSYYKDHSRKNSW